MHEPLHVKFAYVKICYSMLKVLMCFLVRRKVMMRCNHSSTISGGSRLPTKAPGVAGNSE